MADHKTMKEKLGRVHEQDERGVGLVAGSVN